MAIPVKLKVFEGPLNLLLSLLYKNKVDICDIPVAKITGQYNEYTFGDNEDELDVMSEFLTAAATLIDIKCRTLLPGAAQDGEEEDSLDAAENLIQYKMYKDMALKLKGREAEAEKELYRPPGIPAEVAGYVRPLDLDSLLDGVTMQRLGEIFKEVLKRREERVDTAHKGYGSIKKEKISLAERLSYVENYAREHKRFSFRRLLERQGGKIQVITTFLAVLELIKNGAIRATQQEICGELMIDSLI